MTTYMYGEDPAEAMDSAAARQALGERSAEMRSYPYGRAPWGVRGYTEPMATDEYSATTGITPRMLERAREIREVVRRYDRAVLEATIARYAAISAIERKYL